MFVEGNNFKLFFSSQHTLNNQELSAADVERMKHEKRELQKALEQLEKSRDYFDQQIWEKEMQYAKKHEEVSGPCVKLKES